MMNEILKKEKEYAEYIKEHIQNVQLVYRKMLYRGHFNGDSEWEGMLANNIGNHDQSKYETEFDGYRQWFYPCKDEIRNKDKFDFAWNYHQKTNPHHWQYWVMYKTDGSVALDMPYQFIVEMLCDWTAMSIKFKNMPSEWYAKEIGRASCRERV